MSDPDTPAPITPAAGDFKCARCKEELDVDDPTAGPFHCSACWRLVERDTLKSDVARLTSALARTEQERDAMRPVVSAAELAADSITESRHMLLWKWERLLCGAVRDYRREGEPGSAQP